jgi:hypothetical protein
MKKSVKSFEEYINENKEVEIDIETNIEINEEDGDIEVNYNTDKFGEYIEITGILEPYNTGRMIDYNFVPDWYSSDKAEEIYHKNWEDIEAEIKDKYYNL